MTSDKSELDSSVIIVPSRALQNLKTLDVETQSEKFQNMIDWKIIDSAIDAV